MTTLFLVVLFVHWFADFVCQSNWMAQNKSKRWDALAWHVFIYTLVFALLPLVDLVPWSWLMINAGVHFIVDAITSRITAHLWRQQRTHEFFVVIGLDQFIHTLTLLLTLEILS